MRKTLLPILTLVAVCLTGCLELEDTLTVNADGSGTWKFSFVLGPQMTAMIASGGNNKNQTIFREPEFRREIAAVKGAEVIAYRSEVVEGKMSFSGEVRFRSIAEMYRAEALREQFNWEFREVDGRLEARITDGLMSSGDSSSMKIKFESVKPMLVGMKMNRTLVLPNAIDSANATEQQGKRARWFFEIDSQTTEAQFNELNKLSPKAVCGLDGVGFKLPLGPEGTMPIQLTGSTTDDAALRAMLEDVRLTPVRGRLTRVAKYLEDDRISFGDSPLTLTLGLSWPKDLKPVAWSHLTVERAIDDTGRNLAKKPSRLADRTRDINPSVAREHRIEIPVSLAEPDRAATSFDVRGALLLHVPSGISHFKVPGIRDLVGKPIEVEGLEPYGLRVKSFSGNSLRLVGDQPNDAIVDVRLVSEDLENEQKRFYLNRNHFRDEYRLDAGFSSGREKLENPTLVISVAGEVGRFKVPFAFEKLKMP